MRVSTCQSQTRLSGSTSTEQASSLNISSVHKPSRESVTAMSGSTTTATQSNMLNTQPIIVQQVASQFPPKRRYLAAKSPAGRGSTSIQPSSLTRRFNQLDKSARNSINDNFVANIQAGKVQTTTVQDALREFYGKDKATKEKVINKIFQPILGKNNTIKPHPSLLHQQHPTSMAEASANQTSLIGFGLQRFVSVQKGSQKIDQYRMQVSSSNQKVRTEIQPSRRMDKRIKNSNGSNDSKQLAQPLTMRKGSHPAKQRKKGSTSSERREGATLASANLGGKVFSMRQQLSSQNRQQRVTQNSRILLNQNCNFAIAPNSSRKELSKLSNTKQVSSAQQPAQNTGRTRLHRVRSAQGRKDLPNNINGTVQSALNDYAQGKSAMAKQAPQVATSKTAGQKAALDRLKLHRKGSANRQRTQQTTIDERQLSKNVQKPPTGSSVVGVPSAFPQQLPKTQAVRKRVSRDRAQLDLSSCAATTESTNEYSSGRHHLLKRANSQGMSSREIIQPSSSRRSTMAVPKKTMNADSNDPSRQSAAHTEISKQQNDNLASQSNLNTLPAIELTKSVTSTVKKVIQEKAGDGSMVFADDQDCSSVKTPKSSAKRPAKPPKSPLKRNQMSSLQTGTESASVPQTPERAQSNCVTGIMTASPKRPLLLQPITNAPTVEFDADHDIITTTPSKLIAAELKESSTVHSSEEAVPDENMNREAIKIAWSPLLERQEKLEARDYGYSFGSKKVAMGPGFLNLRFMCHCLARAIKRHIDFSKGEHWFLQDLQAETEDIDLEFSYQLPPDLKLTLNPRGVRINDDDDDEDANPFQRENPQSPIRDIETMDIEVDAGKVKREPNFDRKKQNQSGLSHGEPEPEQIKSSDDEGSARLSKFKSESTHQQFNNKAGQARGIKDGAEDDDEICEELDAEQYSDDGFYQPDMDEDDPEEQSIKEIRREQLRKSVLEKDERHLMEQLSQQKVTNLEKQLKTKDKQIAQLKSLVTNGGHAANSEVLAISDQADDEGQSESPGSNKSEIQFYEQKGVKMDRAEQLMAQVGLDPIESHGSLEMSQNKFMQGKLSKRQLKQPAAIIEQPKKKQKRDVENGFVDVSEHKMREFVMTQLRHFDVRMEYDELVFNEDQFVAMPTEKYIAEYCKYVTIACKMENEIPIVCLVYLEKLLLTTGILINKWNWRRLVLICLTLASKIWDDDSLENVHFPKVMSDVTNAEINKLEQLFLEFIDYKLVIKGSEYAKYYFIMRSLADDISKENQAADNKPSIISPFENTRRTKNKKEEWAEFPLRAPISAEKMIELQRQEAKAEVYLKERHEREFLHAYIGNVPGGRKDQTRHPSLLLDRTM